MHKYLIALIVAAAFLPGCQKSSTAASPAKASDAVQQKLQELAGSGATDCGRPKSQAPDQLKPASDCALNAAQNKHPFYVAYDMPGLTVAIAGNSEGKLYSVQSEPSPTAQPGAVAEVKSTPCPAALRVAESGRVTCFAAGSFGMGSTGAAHGGMAAPGGMESPHGKMPMPPAGTPNPHGGSVTAPAQTPNSGGTKPPPSKQP